MIGLIGNVICYYITKILYYCINLKQLTEIRH